MQGSGRLKGSLYVVPMRETRASALAPLAYCGHRRDGRGRSDTGARAEKRMSLLERQLPAELQTRKTEAGRKYTKAQEGRMSLRALSGSYSPFLLIH